jgi:hypothetical protein
MTHIEMSRRGLAAALLFSAAGLLACSGGAPGAQGSSETGASQPAQSSPPPGGAPEGTPQGGAVGTSGQPMQGVTVEDRIDSAVIRVQPVPGAKDYRVFALPQGATVTNDGPGREHVQGTTIYCAGVRQRAAPKQGDAEVLTTIEVAGLTGPTDLIVEAIDRQCPFAGVQGSEHADIAMTNSEVEPAARQPFSIFTGDEIRARYGSLIVNGHGPSPTLGQPAQPDDPMVLASTKVTANPKGATGKPRMTFFSTFDDPTDQPVFVSELPAFDRNQRGKLWQSKELTFFSYGADAAQAFVERGQLHMVLADWTQEIFASLVAMPKRAAQLDTSSYLHVTYTVPTNSTPRRYWWLSLCGAAQPGQTIDGQGKLMGSLIQTPFFHQNDGRNPSMEGWNCLQIFPRDGWPFALGPTNTRPESDIRVMVNQADRPPRDNVVNVSPDQFGNPAISAPSWFRQQVNGQLGQNMLDEEQESRGTTFDVYIKRDRVILYVNGQQRLCNDFPSTPLTMAEAAVGFGQVLYHSAAERLEFSESFNDRTAQLYYLTNTPYLDERTWDDIGYDERVQAPQGFDPSTCYVHQ